MRKRELRRHGHRERQGGDPPSTLCLLPAVFCLLFLAGCRQDMHDQPKYEPLEASDFFNDGRASRPLVPGTVARGHLDEDEALFTGKRENVDLAEFPVPVTRELLERGRNRYDIYCAPCHDRLGSGQGMIVKRGYRQPPSFHDQRLRTAPVGHFFDVTTNGFGAMPDYRAQLSVHDRWAVIGYIKALQFSQNATIADVPEDERAKIASLPAAGPGTETGQAPERQEP